MDEIIILKSYKHIKHKIEYHACDNVEKEKKDVLCAENANWSRGQQQQWYIKAEWILK